MKRTFLLILFVMISSCSSKPVLYPNSYYKQVGKDQANKDVEECMALADEFVEKKTGKKVAQGLGAGAIIGGAMGAATGIFTRSIASSAIRGATVGGATGAAVGGVSSAGPDQTKQNFVNHCLNEKGHKVVGWD